MAAYPGGIHHKAKDEGAPVLGDVLIAPDVDDTVAQALMEMLLAGNHLDSIRRFRWTGMSILHSVAGKKTSRSEELCGLLLRKLPELVDALDEDLCKPLHHACVAGNLPVVKCILGKYPNAIDETTNNGLFPIHYAVGALRGTNRGADIGVINFLLTVDAMVASQTYSEADGSAVTPLRLACLCTNESNASVGFEVIKLLYDARPEAIDTLGGLRVIAEVADFLHLQLRYALIARDLELVTTPDEDGNLPIHQALYDGVVLGTMKLLIDADIRTLRATTRINGNTLLHEACRLGDYSLIQMLLTRYPTEQVHTQNELGKLPIQVLIESDTDEPESADHLSSIFLVLTASPAVLMSGTDLRSE